MITVEQIRVYHEQLHNNQNAMSKENCWVCICLKEIDKLRSQSRNGRVSEAVAVKVSDDRTTRCTFVIPTVREGS